VRWAVLGGNFRSFRPDEGLGLPAGSLFESLYDGLKVEGEGDVLEHPQVAGPVSQTSPGPGCGMAVEGLMEMWKESIENEKLIQELAGAVDVDSLQWR
jgi:hypothetical protein